MKHYLLPFYEECVLPAVPEDAGAAPKGQDMELDLGAHEIALRNLSKGG